MIQKINTFQNCQSTVEDMVDPEGNLVGRCFVIIDEEEHQVYRYPMPVDVAKLQGQRLMGIAGVEIADNGRMRAEVSRLHPKGQGK